MQTLHDANIASLNIGIFSGCTILNRRKAELWNHETTDGVLATTCLSGEDAVLRSTLILTARQQYRRNLVGPQKVEVSGWENRQHCLYRKIAPVLMWRVKCDSHTFEFQDPYAPVFTPLIKMNSPHIAIMTDSIRVREFHIKPLFTRTTYLPSLGFIVIPFKFHSVLLGQGSLSSGATHTTMEIWNFNDKPYLNFVKLWSK